MTAAPSLAELIERIECLKETAECDAVWWHELAEHWPTIRDAIKRYEEALEFYADPDTYFAIGIFPDRPCGDFIADFSDEHDPSYPKPGKKARAALNPTEAE